ncbi:uncharacterized protein H6S33_008684 [Morchella sextelata]|uniref:uncharacterized protein n=1 Tax=Morchella sextelata TaxID=1174677 RepID=UPI001D04BC87|nr:uncharacterized protein H6S33_008684 [Morchella sextelata]KAH0602603.1 hypothetical protein H6S33_008684 [Morchella sextelata]
MNPQKTQKPMPHNFDFAGDSSDDEDGVEGGPLNPEAEDLVDRCSELLDEVEAFQKSLRRNKLEKGVELRHFQTAVKSELRGLQSLTFEAPTSSKIRHSLRSSNLSYLETVWLAAKSTTGIKGLTKSFTITEPGELLGDSEKRGRRKKSSVSVDVVAQNGLQWIKVSTIANSRVLHEIAKAGWEESTSPYDSESETEDTPGHDQEENTQLATSSLSLIKMSKLMHKAAEQTRIQYLHPTVLFFLPNIHPSPSTPEIDTFLSTLLATGARIQCGPDLDLISPKPSLETMLQSLELTESRRYENFSDVLNIDCTILLALISDISNATVPVEPRLHPAILRQLEFEKELALLPNLLWPALRGRRMVCTNTARERFEEIVEIIGSENEKLRAELILDTRRKNKKQQSAGKDQYYYDEDDMEPVKPQESPTSRLKRFQEVSIHTVPEDILFPIVTLPEWESEESLEHSEEKECMARVSKKLSQVNRSVFMMGWKKGYTTVTSNRTVAKLIEGQVGEEEKGPDLFVLDTARSLVGKAKRIEKKDLE